MRRPLHHPARRKNRVLDPRHGRHGAGGLCKVKGEWRCIVDKRANDGDKVTVIAQSLARFDLEDVFMSEETRALIARSGKKKAS